MGIRLLRNKFVLTITLALLSLFSVFAFTLTKELPDFTIDLFVADPVCKPTIETEGTTSLCPGGSVKLTSSIKGEKYTYTWYKNGVKIENQTAESITVSEAGKYTVRVNDEFECKEKNEESNQVIVTVNPKPTADFTFTNNDACSGTAVKFTSIATGSGLSYSWDFGDGTPISKDASPSHVFIAHGSGSQNFNVSLTVTTDKGCSTTIPKVVKVKQVPAIDLKELSNFRNCTGEAFELVLFDNSSSPDAKEYTINWGDGSAAYSSSVAPSELTHTYPVGIYSLVYTIKGKNDCIVSKTIPVYNITNPAVSATSKGNSTGCGPLTITFPITNVEDNHPSTIYEIDFGDGSPKQRYTHPAPATVTHTYTKSSCGSPGSPPSFPADAYIFTIIASNACGSTPAAVGGIRVYSNPEASFTVPSQSFCISNPINFTNTTVEGAYSDCSKTTTYTWDFGDGAKQTVFTKTNMSHAYVKAGTYKVSLKAQNGCGATTHEETIIVIAPPQAAFTVNKSNNESCANLAVTTTNTSIGENLSYSWSVTPNTGYTSTSGTLTSGNPVFNFTQAGTYQIKLTATNSCGSSTATENIIVKDKPIVQLPSDKNYCGPQTIKFNATNTAHVPIYNAKNGTISSYTWTVNNGATFTGGTSSVSQYPEISFPATGTYTVTVQATNECGTSAAETQVITINELPTAPTVTPVTVCNGKPATLTASGNGQTYKWYDAATGGTLKNTGAEYTISQATITTTYYVEAVSVQGCISATRTPVTLTVTEPVANNIINSSASICQNSQAPKLTSTQPTGGDGKNYTYTWESSTDGLIFNNAPGTNNEKDYTPGVLTQKTWFRRIVNSGVCGASISTPIAIITIGLPAAPVLADATIEICSGKTATLTAPAVTGITYKWYDAASGGTLLKDGQTYTTPTLTADAIYYVEAVNSSNCASTTRTAVTIKVNPLITNNTLSANQNICAGSVAEEIIGSTPEGGNKAYTYRWFKSTTSASSGFTTIANATAKDLDPGTVSVKTWYYREVASGGCTSNSAPVEINVIAAPAAPAAPAVADQSICKGNTATLTATAPGGSYIWYDKDNNKVADNTNTFTTPILDATTTYFVETKVNACTSATRTEITVTVQQPIAGNTITGQQNLCKGQPAGMITGALPTGGSGSYTYLWESSTTSETTGFAAAAGFNTGKDYNPGTLAQTTWFRRIVISGLCANNESNVVEVNVTLAITGNTIVGNQTICENAPSATITGSEPTGGTGTFTYAWESSIDGTDYKVIATATAQDYLPGALTQTTWYRRKVTSGSCTVTSNAVKVTVEKNIASNTITADQTICKGISAAPLTGSTPTGGSGAYTFTWESSTTSATDGFAPATGVNSNVTYAPAALTQTTWFRRKVSSGVCQSNYSQAIKISVTPPITGYGITGAQEVCYNSVATTLEGQEPAGGEGAGSFTYVWESSTASAATGFTTAIGNNSGVSYTSDPLTQTTWFRRKAISGACTVISDAIQVTVKELPAAPTVSAQAICAGTAATLTAIGTADTYEWFTAASGGTAISTGAIYKTDALSATTTYYVQSIKNGCSSAIRTAVTVTVEQPITDNSIARDQVICSGATPSILKGSNPIGGNGVYTFTWLWSNDNIAFTAAPGQNTAVDYAPPALTQNTYFKRVVKAGVCQQSESNVVLVTANPSLTNNMIEEDQEVCYNSAPAPLKGSTPVGGDGNYEYSWQISTTAADAGFVAAPGMNNAKDYTSEALTATTWFRRIVKSGGCEVISAAIQVTVNPLPAAPVVADKEICEGSMTTLAVLGAGGTYTWFEEVQGGTPLHTGSTYETPALQSTTTYYVQVTDAKGCVSPRSAVTVKVNPLLDANTVSASQAICMGEKPADLTGSTPTGGNGTYSYLWEQSTDNKTWSPATGINTSRDYQTTALTQETWYRRQVSSGGCENVSDPVQIVVNSVIANNTISEAQTVCTGTAPVSLSGTTPIGGDGSYTYRWEISTNGATGIFSAAPGENSLAGYTAGPLTQTTWFRRVVSSGGCSNPSEAIEIKVNEKIGNNTISADQVVCHGSTAALIVGAQPTGGNGTYTYIWEVSTLSATSGFTQAPGVSNGQNYTPTALTQTSWFRRRVVSGPCEEHVSSVVKVTVNDAIAGNSISGNQIICAGSAPAQLTGTEPTGGSGSYTYLWEYSTESESTGYKAAPGMNNGVAYLSASLTQTTWFRRTVLSTPCPAMPSNVIKVMVNPVITENTIAGVQTICAGDVPTLFAGSIPKGGDGVYVYLWEYSMDGITYAAAPSKNNEQNYQAAGLTQDTWFRRVVTSGNCASITGEIKINVNQPITANQITEDQAICMGATPVELSGSEPSGGNGNYIYQWQSSTKGSNTGFVAAAGTNNGVDYDPGAITQTTWFRRVVTAGPCPPSFSNAVKIAVNPPLANNKISTPQSVCTGVTPAPLIGTQPTGGDGQYRYVWESSTAGSSTGFIPAEGINNEATYAPEQLEKTTWFRRAVYSGGCVHVSVAIQITVQQQITGNNISSDQTLCVGSTAILFTGTAVQGGSGNYSYTWESSTDNVTYASAKGINNNPTYDPGILATTTWFRRVVASAPCSETVSNIVKITINAPIGNNTIGSTQRICAGTSPAVLQGTAPSAGSGTYTYLWQQSTTSATVGFTTAAGANTGATYQPEALNRTTWFRRVVTSLPCENNTSAAVVITVDPLPSIPVVTGSTICPGVTAMLKASTTAKDVKLEWYDEETGGNLLYTGTTYKTDVLQSTTNYYVQAVNSFGCASATRVKVTALVLTSTADAGQDVTIIKGKSTGLHGKGGETYQWSPAAGLSNPLAANPVATPLETTTYTLTVTTKEGCSYTDEVTVTVLPRIDPTNAITVNRDNINDWWEIRNIQYYPNCRVQVYTRWGALIFESNGYQQPWDGTHNGKPLPMAAYYYIIDLGINENPVSGSVTLIK